MIVVEPVIKKVWIIKHEKNIVWHLKIAYDLLDFVDISKENSPTTTGLRCVLQERETNFDLHMVVVYFG